MQKAIVMTNAWEIAREGVKKFGGKVKEYFAEALRIAWGIAKGENEVSVIEERAAELEEMEIEMTGGNADTKRAAKLQAEKEYNDLIVSMKKINKITGKQSVNIEAAKNKMGKMNVKQYVALMQKTDHILRQLKQREGLL